MTADRRAGARELSRLLAHWEDARRPAYLALSERVRLLVLDGRLPVGVRLPPEREARRRAGCQPHHGERGVRRAASRRVRRQPAGLGVVDDGADRADGAGPGAGLGARTGAGRRARPGARRPARPTAACTRRTRLRSTSLPKHLPTTGYDYRGLPVLRTQVAERLTARGLPTAPGQVLVTAGGLQGIRLALQAAAAPGRPGAGRAAGLPQRPRRAARPGRAAGARAGDGRRLGPHGAGGRGAADRPARRLPDARLPEPERRADGRRHPAAGRDDARAARGARGGRRVAGRACTSTTRPRRPARSPRTPRAAPR
nr:hypothetical protein [Angustibacter aerolatus]